MQIDPLNATLEKIILRAKALKWCLKYGCGTCGAHEFRSAIKRFNRDQLIEELKSLSAEFVDDITNKSALLLLMYEVALLNDFEGLSSELAGTNAGIFLDRAIRIKHERQFNTKTRIEKEQSERKIKIQKNAQKNIWAAIKRKDLSAMSHLLSKNLDLNEIGPAGIILSECLKQVEHGCKSELL